MTTYNWISCKCMRVLIVHFYRLAWFHIWRRFCANPFFMISDSGKPVTYARIFCKNKPSHKVYFCMPVSTIHYILLHNPKILHKKAFLRQPVTRAIIYHPRQNCHVIHCYTHTRFTLHCPRLKIPPSQIIFLLVETQTSRFNKNKLIQTQIWVKTFPFSLL